MLRWSLHKIPNLVKIQEFSMVLFSFSGGPEFSTFYTYDITYNKREGGGRKIVENLIVLSNTIFMSLEKNVDCLKRRWR